MDNVTIVRSRTRKSVGIQILPDTSVKVTIPFFFPKMFVSKILREKEDWIIATQQKVIARTERAKKDGHYLYLGKSYPLQLRPGQKELVEVSDKLYVASTNEKFVKKYLMNWYKEQARKMITSRVSLYAKKAGSEYRSVSITSAETRWGSCSSRKTLNFNWKLVMAPIEVMDYVIAHELAHLTEMNHSRSFWETVRKMYPLYREYRMWLRRNGDSLTV